MKTNLQMPALRAMKPDPHGKRIAITDAACQGLTFHVQPSGLKSWSVVYHTPGGAMRRYKIGNFPGTTLAKARKKAIKVLQRVQDGQDPQQEKVETRKAGTFKDLAADYMERYAKKPDKKTGLPRKKSWAEDQRIIDAYLLPEFQHVLAKDVLRRDVRSMLDKLAVTAPVQANRVLATIRKIYNWALSQDLVTANPCQLIPAPGGEETSRERVLTEHEIRAVWKAGEEELDAAIAAVFKLVLITGQRSGEVKSMAWAELDMEGAVWTIPGEKAKNGISHRVPLSNSALRLLRDLREQQLKLKNEKKKRSPFVFPNPRRPDLEPIREVQKAWQRLRPRAVAILREQELLDKQQELDITIHDLRRTVSTCMAGEPLSIPDFVVQRVLNHVDNGSSGKVGRTYNRYSYDKEKRDALDKWATRLAVIVSGLKDVSAAGSEGRR